MQINQNDFDITNQTTITYSDTLSTIIAFYYPAFWLATVVIGLFLAGVYLLRERQYAALSSIGLGTLIALFFNLFFVHKSSHFFYFHLSYLIAGLIIALVLPRILLKRESRLLSVGIFVVFALSMFLSYSYLNKKIAQDYYIAPNAVVSNHIKTSQRLEHFFNSSNVADAKVVLNREIPLDVSKCPSLQTVLRLQEFDYREVLNKNFLWFQSYDVIVLSTRKDAYW